MITSSTISLFLPDYNLLPMDTRAAFESTDDGENLTEQVLLLSSKLNDIVNNSIFNAFINAFNRVAFSKPTMSGEEFIEAAQIYLDQSMRHSKKYQTIKQHIANIKIQNANSRRLNLFEPVYFNLLQEMSKRYMSPMNLDGLNKIYAQKLLTHIKQLDAWAKEYSDALQSHINDNICLTSDEIKLFLAPPISSKQRVRDSLSHLYTYLLKRRKNPKEINRYADAINKAADAHAFLQATGFATQNETSWLAVFDIVNYFRMAGGIAEAKSILFKFLEPFTPLLLEYSNINREQNIIKQIIRTIIPFLIVSLAVTLVAALLSSIVIPEIAFIFILIPTLYLGLIAASGYVVVKDQVYNMLSQLWFGGQFEIPEYQVNENMTLSFGLDNAIKVRLFYITEINTCLEKEIEYKGKARLSDLEIKSRQENTERHNLLLLEWYDMHSNPHLSTNAARDIALNRLRLEGRMTYEAMKQSHQPELETTIPMYANEIANKIKETIYRQSETNKHTFFFKRPNCLNQKKKVEDLFSLNKEIQYGSSS